MNASLRAHQQGFAAAITAEDGAEASWAGLLRPGPEGRTPLLHLYRHAFRIRLIEALRENYPVLHRVLGDDAFDRLARAFIQACPSRQPSIRWFGATLAAFLEQAPEHLPHPALIDLARMEWVLSTTFDGPDAPTLAVATLAALPANTWPDLVFRPHPTVSLIPMAWAVEPLWSAINQDPEGETRPPDAHHHHLLTWRQGDRTQWRSVAADEAELLEALLAGKPFSDLCAIATREQRENAAVTVAGYLRVWIEAGMLGE